MYRKADGKNLFSKERFISQKSVCLGPTATIEGRMCQGDGTGLSMGAQAREDATYWHMLCVRQAAVGGVCVRRPAGGVSRGSLSLYVDAQRCHEDSVAAGAPGYHVLLQWKAHD